MTTILITGGSGLVGSHLTKLLLGEGFAVRHLSRSAKPDAAVPTFEWNIAKGFIDPVHWRMWTTSSTSAAWASRTNGGQRSECAYCTPVAWMPLHYCTAKWEWPGLGPRVLSARADQLLRHQYFGPGLQRGGPACERHLGKAVPVVGRSGERLGRTMPRGDPAHISGSCPRRWRAIEARWSRSLGPGFTARPRKAMDAVGPHR
ncbi:MAG: NAD-dependent epimerase/dehydratase family protein [Flavobacteriales bacterium]|nr:NAD-dependent epimerase/dehydratase family protein [Flavobacteriales bacterium]